MRSKSGIPSGPFVKPAEPRHPVGFLVFLFVAGMFALVAALAWLVNVEVAAKAIWGTELLGFRRVPWLGPALEALSHDLSTVSPLLMFLVAVFPLSAGIRLLRGGGSVPSASREVFLPYPRNLATGMVWAGIFGTLIGLWIALRQSGVDLLGPTGEGSGRGASQILTQLFSGTGTAILSSVSGIVGAYLVLQPIPALFRFLGPSQSNLEVDLHGAVRDLSRSLDRARGSADGFVRDMAVLLGQIQRASTELRGLRVTKSFGAIENALQQQLAEQRKILEVLRSTQRVHEKSGEGLRAIRDVSGKAHAHQTALTAALGRSLAGIHPGQAAASDHEKFAL